MRLLLLLWPLWLWSAVDGYKILCIFPLPSRSHNNLGKGIVDALLEAGHEVTWASPYPGKPSKNLRFIDFSYLQKLTESIDMSDPKNVNAGTAFVKQFARNITEATVMNEQLRHTLVNEQYDAVVTEWFFSDVEAGYAAIQQVPWILLSGMTIHPHLESLVDEVRSIPNLPLMFNNYPVPMNLWQRVVNTAMHVIITVGEWLDYSSDEAYYQSRFAPLAAARGVPLPPYGPARHNVSVLLVNSHPAIAPPRSLPPNVVDIAGYHIDEHVPPLPKDLQELLDASPKGVVYFSMGSVLKSATFPERTRRSLLQLLGELPYTVLWKFEEPLENVPKNVHVRPWMPQASILAHPNVKLFITHGGLLSTLEAVNSGVPLLAVPVFGDQPMNADRCVRAGFARKVTFRPDMAGELKEELNEMLGNDSYYKRMKYISKIFRNRLTSPKKVISHYVQLAIETKGAYHLRSASHLYAWYEIWMVDQLVLLLILLFIIYKILKAIVNWVRNKLTGNKRKQKRN